MEQIELNRFKQAQECDYLTALSEIRAGRKQSHWMLDARTVELCGK